jgi:Matrixin
MADATRTVTLAAQTFQESPHLRQEAEASPKLDELRSSARQLMLEPGGTTYYVLEGDLIYDDDELELYALQQDVRAKAKEVGLTPAPSGREDALVVVASGGKIVRWRPEKVLSYTVLRESFPSQENYDLAVESVNAATQAWQDTCDIVFEHRSEFDGHTNVSASPEDIDASLVFTVRYIDGGGQFIAAAFFPTYPPARRRVLIDPSFFADDLSFDRVGVLRHELGHTLGFRHEHIRSEAPAACPDEPAYDTLNLTDYDPRSVMHYFCGAVGSRELAITELDRLGAQKVYGPSAELSSMMLVD